MAIRIGIVEESNGRSETTAGLKSLVCFDLSFQNRPYLRPKILITFWSQKATETQKDFNCTVSSAQKAHEL